MSPAPPAARVGPPPGLVVLFLTVAWQNLAFYGVRSLLVLYMTRRLLYDQSDASLVYGLFTAAVYLTPLIGGAIADRCIGPRAAVLAGGTLLAAGQFALLSEPLFAAGLALIAVGNGLFLPVLPSQIRNLYAPGDPRAAGAYNIYYAGVNLGAFVAPLVCGTLGELYGWRYGFAAAGSATLVGLAIYLAGRRHLPASTRAPSATVGAADPAGTLATRLVLLGAVGLVAILFRCAYEQVGNTLPLWLDARVDRQLGGWTVPVTWFQALNPLFVLALTPLLVILRARRGGRSPVVEMALGAALVGVAFASIALADSAAGGRPVPGWVAAAFFLLLTVGELLVLPAGLALFGSLAPPHLAATLIACWYFTKFAGSLAAGVIGATWSLLVPAAFFLLLAVIAALASLALLAVARLARHGDPVPAYRPAGG